jgi:hypothetical protein
MSEQTAQLRGVLHHLAQILREARRLGPEAQRRLAGLVDELGQALDAPTVTPEEVQHLATTAAQLSEALRTRDRGLLAGVRDRLQEAAVEAEAQAPLLGLIRRLAEMLANIGI